MSLYSFLIFHLTFVANLINLKKRITAGFLVVELDWMIQVNSLFFWHQFEYMSLCSCISPSIKLDIRHQIELSRFNTFTGANLSETPCWPQESTSHSMSIINPYILWRAGPTLRKKFRFILQGRHYHRHEYTILSPWLPKIVYSKVI